MHKMLVIIRLFCSNYINKDNLPEFMRNRINFHNVLKKLIHANSLLLIKRFFVINWFLPSGDLTTSIVNYCQK